MDESIGIALQVYFLGFVIALAMAFLIKLILFIIRSGNRRTAAMAEKATSAKVEGGSEKSKKAEDRPGPEGKDKIDNKEGAA